MTAPFFIKASVTGDWCSYFSLKTYPPLKNCLFSATVFVLLTSSPVLSPWWQIGQCELWLWDLAAALRSLPRARYCMQGHHLSASSSDRALPELTRGLGRNKNNHASHSCIAAPPNANRTAGVKRLNNDSDLEKATAQNRKYAFFVTIFPFFHSFLSHCWCSGSAVQDKAISYFARNRRVFLFYLSSEMQKFSNWRRKFAKPSMPFHFFPFVYPMSHYFRCHTA